MTEFGDGTKLDIRDGCIAYRIYGQDGSMIPMTISDSKHNRRFVEWVQIHDRYTPLAAPTPEKVREGGMEETR